MAVSSRIFGVKIDGRKTDVLAPFADMLNHRRPRHTHWFYDDRYKSFIIQALDNIHQGQEVNIKLFIILVYDSYGKKCNSRFLLNYGFIVEDNDGNEYPITLCLEDSYPKYKDKLRFFNDEKELKRTFRIQENILDNQVIDFFSYLRFLLYEGDIKILAKVIISLLNIHRLYQTIKK
jgi:histone-lysine N-methyltransferase SETD3